MSNSDNNNDLELDTNWIANYENNEKDYKMFYKEDIFVINLMVIYVNIENEIVKIKEELLPLKSPNILIREQLLELIKNNNVLQNTKYSLFSLLVYNITLDPEHLYIYLKSKQTQGQMQQYFRSIHNIDTIHFEPSISIFHDINQVTFIFREDNKYSNNIHTKTHTSTKKIYINHHHNHNNHTKTKRK
jgi:hypothetical protein